MGNIWNILGDILGGIAVYLGIIALLVLWMMPWAQHATAKAADKKKEALLPPASPKQPDPITKTEDDIALDDDAVVAVQGDELTQ